MKRYGKKEWGGTIHHSHGCSNSSGVAVLIPPTLGLDFKCDNTDRDNDGRILLLSCRLEGNIIGIYHKKTVQMQNFSTGGIVKARRLILT